MRILARVLGAAFLVAALAVLAADVTAAPGLGALTLMPLGQLWYSFDPGSLNLVQAVIERYIWEPLWEPVLASVLRLPAAPVFAGLGVVLLAAGFWPRRARPITQGEEGGERDTGGRE